MHLLFICRGNVFRSLTAETYLRSLELPNVTTESCGTNVNMTDPQEREYFNNTLALLERHDIRQFAKNESHKLSQASVDASDVVVIANQRAFDEAVQQVDLPHDTIILKVVDIGEGNRIATEDNREELEELIYDELTYAVDEILHDLHLKP